MLDVLRPLIGVAIFLGLGVLLSASRKDISIKTVGTCIVVLFFFAFMVLYFSFGRSTLQSIADVVTTVLGYGKAGAEMLFGNLLHIEGVGFVFALQVFPMIIFISALMSLLYYLGVMQMVIKFLGGAIGFVFRISKVEAVCAATNMFSSMSDSMLFVRPYVPKLTKSEMFCAFVVGLSSVGTSTLASYALMGIPMEYLLASIFMTVPSGVLMAKLFMPETEPLRYDPNTMNLKDEVKETSMLGAISSGAELGIKIVLTVAAMLVAFVSLIAMVNGFLGWIGGIIGWDSLSFETLTGYLFSPLAWIIGADWDDSVVVGSLIGTKTFINEFVAYAQLGPMLGTGTISEHSEIIAIFSLCGFANIGSVSILIGICSTLAAERKEEVMGFAFKTLLAATLANMLNGAVASFVLNLQALTA